MVTLELAFELPPEASDLKPAAQLQQLQLSAQRMRVSDLIAQAVSTQLLLRRLRQTPRAAYLDEAQIAAQLQQGRVALEQAGASDPDLREEIERACAGFAAGRFRMLLDGEWLQDLDEEVDLGEARKLVFLRLTPLVGG